MVGDVKQSIYRFRLARPELFMEKFDRYRKREEDAPDREETAEGCRVKERRIDLKKNSAAAGR